MKLKFWKKRKTEVKAASVIPLPQGSWLEYVFGNNTMTDSQAMEFYRTNSTVATAVDKISSKVEQITPVLKLKDDTFIEDHPVLTLLNNPNPFNTWQEFIGKVCRHYLLTHDSYLSLLGNINMAPLEIYAVKPQNVSTTPAKDSFPGIYYVSNGPATGNYKRTEEKRKIRFLNGNLREMYHIMGFSSRPDDINGDSPLEAAALEARQQIQGRKHNLSVLKQGGRLSLVIGFKEPDGIEEEEHQRRKRKIQEDLGGSQNAGAIAVISGADMDIKEVGTTNKDMDYANLDRVASDAIYLRYDVPLPLVSIDASTYNNIQNALIDLYENTVLPLTDILFAGLSKVILPRYGLEDLAISYNPESISILIRQKLEEIETRKKINIETTNELRALLPNRESIQNGDVLYQPANLVPVGQDLFTDDEETPEELAARLAKDLDLKDLDLKDTDLKDLDLKDTDLKDTDLKDTGGEETK